MEITFISGNSVQKLASPELIDVAGHQHWWLHITASDQKDLEAALSSFEIHPLTIEDMLNPATRIKIERFHHYIFFIFRGLELSDLNIVSRNFYFVLLGYNLITVTSDPRYNIQDIIDNWQRWSSSLGRGPEFLIHRILDTETDHTLNIVHNIEKMVDHFEEKVFQNDLETDITRIFVIKGVLQHIKRIIHSHHELFEHLIRLDQFSEDSLAFYRDVNDHSIRIREQVDSIIDSITSVMEAYVTVSTKRTNEIIKALTILTAIMLPISLVAGIFGMNFEMIPGLKWQYGFYASMLIMGGIGVLMFYLFKKKGWL